MHDNPNLEREDNDVIQALISVEENPENSIKVPEKLYSPHPLRTRTFSF